MLIIMELYGSLYLFCCAIQADFIKKIQAKDRQCGEKYKWEKIKEKRQKNKIRQLLGCLIEYGELFELIPEIGVLLVIASFFRGCWVVFDEPGEELDWTIFALINIL